MMNKRKRLYEIVEVGAAADRISRGYDLFTTLVLILNLLVSIAATFDGIAERFGGALEIIEAVTIFIFMIDFLLRLATAVCRYPGLGEGKAAFKYIFSFTGLIDLFSFLPYYLPVFFPAGLAAFRMFRVIRIFRLFRLNAYYDSLNVITEVIASKKQQLFSSVFIILILMLASSLCMYSLEHEAQPEVFQNAFSGIWWSVSTLLTVGYGDIYPITTLGRIFSIIITFLGVGMVAIPTGIISAGFVEQYSRLQQAGDGMVQAELSFISIDLRKGDAWCGKTVRELKLPGDMVIAMIMHGGEMHLPKGDIILQAGDSLILTAEAQADEKKINLQQIPLTSGHPWIGLKIRELDISRQTYVVMIRRGGTMLAPHGDTRLFEKDLLFLYSRNR